VILGPAAFHRQNRTGGTIDTAETSACQASKATEEA
jgi:hypothetical protein